MARVGRFLSLRLITIATAAGTLPRHQHKSVTLGETPMSRIDRRTLISLGRKAGLHTSELYSALASRPPEGAEVGQEQTTDGNGFISGYTEDGRRIYRPREEADPR